MKIQETVSISPENKIIAYCFFYNKEKIAYGRLQVLHTPHLR